MATIALTKVIAYVRRLSDVEGCQSDRQLLDRFVAARDEFAFAEIVRRHGPMILATCRRVLRHEQDAEDAFQATFLVLARKARSIRHQESIGGWLHQVAHRLAVRARCLADRRNALLAPMDNEPAAPRHVDQALLGSLDAELASLPECYRTALVLCYLEGRSQIEAARLLAVSADAVNSRLKRARECLRQRLARRGALLSMAALVQALSVGAAEASFSSSMIVSTARIALKFVTDTAPADASASAVALAQGALPIMFPAKWKLMCLLAVVLAAFGCSALLGPNAAQGDPLQRPASGPEVILQEKEKLKPARKRCIVLWMIGGPSQLDTFDPKGGNIALFKAIDTNVKGLQFAETLPKLAKQADKLALLRGVSHREGDHMRASILMRTGVAPANVAYPSFACALANELGADIGMAPRLVSIDPQFLPATAGFGPGFLDGKNAPVIVGGKFNGALKPNFEGAFSPPSPQAYEAVDKQNAAAMEKAIAKAFDLSDEKADLRDAYSRSRFGNGCLLARRLLERGVPVVEIALHGWDTHGMALPDTQKVCGPFDDGMSTLLKDLHERKLLDGTLIVWMGEFGRTPRINAAGGRDHYPFAFTVVMAGAGIKGGQVHGKTSEDGNRVDEGTVGPGEILATAYQALGIDPAKTNTLPGGQKIRLAEGSAVIGVLR